MVVVGHQVCEWVCQLHDWRLNVVDPFRPMGWVLNVLEHEWKVGSGTESGLSDRRWRHWSRRYWLTMVIAFFV